MAGTMEEQLGGEVYHYHTKLMMKEAHTGPERILCLAPVSCENGDPANRGPQVPIFMGKWGPGSLFS